MARVAGGQVATISWSAIETIKGLRFAWGRDLIVGYDRAYMAIFEPGADGLELVRERELPFEAWSHSMAPDDTLIRITDRKGDPWLVDLRTLEISPADGPLASGWGFFAPSPEGLRWMAGTFMRFDDTVGMDTILFLPEGERREETLHFPPPPTLEYGWSMVRSWAFWR